ncbi:MAG: hypothetical protein EON89_01130 [Brevundimonas sp.]|nr:MAG: hypothetical protein EON89_01130 [Brevundimonas sp.]
MILTCPSCATSYFAPDEAIGPNGRTVRCKSCANTWKAVIEEPLELTTEAPVVKAESPVFGKRDEATTESLAETPAQELPQAFRARAEQQRKLRRAAAHGVVWAGIASGFAALLGAAWLFRMDVVEMMPRTAAAYAAVGLTVNPTGLEFEAVTARPSPNDPSKVLISGALRNVRDNERIAPPVRVALLDAHGAEIGFKIVQIDAAPVLPGGVQGFAALIDDPGAKGAGVGVDFVLDAKAHAAPPAHHAAEPAHAPEPAHVEAHAEATPQPIPAASEAGLRPALSPDAAAPPANMQPIDAVPVAMDSHGPEAVSASHG